MRVAVPEWERWHLGVEVEGGGVEVARVEVARYLDGSVEVGQLDGVLLAAAQIYFHLKFIKIVTACLIYKTVPSWLNLWDCSGTAAGWVNL